MKKMGINIQKNKLNTQIHIEMIRTKAYTFTFTFNILYIGFQIREKCCFRTASVELLFIDVVEMINRFTTQ